MNVSFDHIFHPGFYYIQKASIIESVALNFVYPLKSFSSYMPEFNFAGLSKLFPSPLSRRQRHSWSPPNPIPSDLRRRCPPTSPSLRGRWLGLAPLLGKLDPQHLSTAPTCRLDFHSRLRKKHTFSYVFFPGLPDTLFPIPPRKNSAQTFSPSRLKYAFWQPP